MDKVTLTINGNTFEMQHITLGLWLDIAKINDEIYKDEYNGIQRIELQSKLLALAFGIPNEDINQLAIEDLIPAYNDVIKTLQDLLISKIDKKNSEVTTTT